MFACFALAFAIALGRRDHGARLALAGCWPASPQAWPPRPRRRRSSCSPRRWPPAPLAWWSLGPTRSVRRAGDRRMAESRARRPRRSGAAIAVALLFVVPRSSGRRPRAASRRPHLLPARRRSRPTTCTRGTTTSALLAWSSSGGLRWTEALVLVLAAVGAVTAWAPPDPVAARGGVLAPLPHRRNAALTLAIFSAIPYKTPWNLLPFYAADDRRPPESASRRSRGRRPRERRTSCWPARSRSAAAHLGWQAWRASVVYASDPRNPYVYAQTVPDAVRMAARIRDLAALHRRARADAGHGDRAAARAMAAALVSADDDARRLLDGRERTHPT